MFKGLAGTDTMVHGVNMACIKADWLEQIRLTVLVSVGVAVVF